MIVSQLELGLPVVKPDWLKVLADYLYVWSIGLNVLIGFQKAYINVWITSWKFTVNIAKYKLMFVYLNKTLAVLERHSFFNGFLKSSARGTICPEGTLFCWQ